MLDKVLLSLA